MKRLSTVIIIIAMTLVSLAAVSCGEESDDALLTGVFTKPGVDLGEGFWTNGTARSRSRMGSCVSSASCGTTILRRWRS